MIWLRLAVIPVGLILRINHERPTSGSSDEDGVLSGHLITGKTFCVPLSDLICVSKDFYQT